MARVPVVVSDEKKQQWEAFVEDQPEIDNVSDLVRTSVSKYIAKSNEDKDYWTEEEIEAILEYLDDIDSTTSTNQALIESVRDEQASKDKVEEAITYQRSAIENIVESAVQKAFSEELGENE